MFLAGCASGICAGSYCFCSVFFWALIGPHAFVEGGGRESPGRRGTFLCFAKEKYPKERRPHCLRPLRFATGQPAVLGFGGVSLELASLRQSRALIRQTLRSSAHPEGQGEPNIHTGLCFAALRSAPTRGRKRHALRRPSRAQRWPEWMSGCLDVWLPTPAGCACGGAVAG